MAKYKIHYKLSHANGAVADECWNEVFELEIGDGQLDRCLEKCILEAKINELQTFLLPADEAFGQVHDEAIQVMKKSEFPKDLEIKLNSAVKFNTPTGDSFVGCIEDINYDDIRVNFNHPLAGCDVVFQVKVLEKY